MPQTLVQIFGGPRVVRDGAALAVPEGSKRLVVLVALNGCPVDRRKAAGQLWPAVREARAAGNLRSALWRLPKAGIDAIVSDGAQLSLRKDVGVDVLLACAWAHRLIEGSHVEGDLGGLPWSAAALDLLPGWYDDWVIFERERVRHLLLHGLEALARRLSAAHRYPAAVEAAMTAVAADPLRESAHRMLVEVHLAEGNVAEAQRGYLLCRRTFRRELGIEPSERLRELVRGVLPSMVPPAALTPA